MDSWDPENDDTADLPRDRGFEEAPAVQGLKSPPQPEPGEESGEWTRGGGTDPNEGRTPKG